MQIFNYFLSGGVITHLRGAPGYNGHTVHPSGDTQVWRINGVITDKEKASFWEKNLKPCHCPTHTHYHCRYTERRLLARNTARP
jgi:hypothetical protein